jgi:hypothetical protein
VIDPEEVETEMSNLPKKLLIKPGYRVVIINAPDGYLELLGPLPEGATLLRYAHGSADIVHLFVKNTAELEKFTPRALTALKREGVFWISYPKQSAKVNTDITRDRGWGIIHQAGFEGVAIVSINDVWSALRFRRSESVVRRQSPE